MGSPDSVPSTLFLVIFNSSTASSKETLIFAITILNLITIYVLLTLMFSVYRTKLIMQKKYWTKLKHKIIVNNMSKKSKKTKF